MDEDRKDWTLSHPEDLGIWAPPQAHCLRCGAKLDGADVRCSVCGYGENAAVGSHDAARRAFEGHDPSATEHQPAPYSPQEPSRNEGADRT